MVVRCKLNESRSVDAMSISFPNQILSILILRVNDLRRRLYGRSKNPASFPRKCSVTTKAFSAIDDLM